MFNSWLITTVKTIDNLTEKLGHFLSWFTLIIVLLTFAIVILRYGFNLGWIAMQESVLYFHGAIFMLGAAFTLKNDGHVRVDIFYQKFSPRQKALVNLFGTLFLLFPVCIFIGYVSYDYVLVSWQILEGSSEAGGLPAVFISKSYILVFVILMCLQAVAEIGRNIIQLNKREVN
jgi:TRAP-type mannitol/chloroaromatic compound transport system permease small subunit